MFTKKPSIIDKIAIHNDHEQDELTVPLDTQNTTRDGEFRLMSKNLYTPQEPLPDLQNGLIVKEITDPSDFEYTQKLESQTANKKDLVPIRYKIYVLGRSGQIMPTPEDFDDSVISALDDYSVSPGYEGVLAVGMEVFVNVKKRLIMFSEQDNVSETASKKGSEGNKSNNRAPVQQSGGPINLDKVPQDQTVGEAYATVKENGKKTLKKENIKLKAIVSYSSQRMRADAADKFNELAKGAADDGVKVIATSGFREMQVQVDLYNDRYMHPYPRKPSENTLSPNGRRIGVAAYPGTSNHQGGTAVDIDVGEHKSEANRYAGNMGQHPAFVWMTKNAGKYGFDNIEGRGVNEPWHWVYNRPPPASATDAKEAADGPDGGKS